MQLLTLSREREALDLVVVVGQNSRTGSDPIAVTAALLLLPAG